MWRYFLHKIKQILPTDRAMQIRSILAAMYAFSAWNLVILTFYYSIKDEIPTTTENKEKFVKRMKEASIDVKFVEIKGLSINTSKDEENETNGNIEL